MQHKIVPEFIALPMRSLADAALSRATELGATYAAFRGQRTRGQHFALSDAMLDENTGDENVSFAVRLLYQGVWGDAYSTMLTIDEAISTVERAIADAGRSASIGTPPVFLASEPMHANVTWTSVCDIDPFNVPDTEKIELMTERSAFVLDQPQVKHVTSSLGHTLTTSFYADTAGSLITQQAVRTSARFEAIGISEDGTVTTAHTLATPAQSGWEYVLGKDGAVDWQRELSELGEIVGNKQTAPPVRPGQCDVVLDPSHLWRTMHESIGLSTALTTSFTSPDQLYKLRYGSPLMNVTADRTTPRGLATTGYDDEGVQSQSWDVIDNGMFVGTQLNRASTWSQQRVLGTARSNGCAFADSPISQPIHRTANFTLKPADVGPSTDELISQVDDGLYIVGDKSCSTDQRRFHFRATGQRCYRIHRGELVGLVNNVAYQSPTIDFWGSLAAVGGPQTFALHGTTERRIGQHRHPISASYGCPSALFHDLRIVNTKST